MADSEFISFKEMCARFDVTPRTLRYYEYIELLSPRKEGRSRFYGPREIARMKLILRGRRFGFSLEQIRQLLELYDPAERNVTQTRATLVTARERLADMERQHRDLAGAIEELRQQIAQGETWLANLKSGA